MARSPGRDTLISLEYRSPLTGGPALATLGCLLEGLPIGARTRPRRETASSKRSTPCSAVSSDPATVPRSTTSCPAPSSRQSPTPTRSSPRKCPPSSSGRSPKTTPAASRSQRSPSWGSQPRDLRGTAEAAAALAAQRRATRPARPHPSPARAGPRRRRRRTSRLLRPSTDSRATLTGLPKAPERSAMCRADSHEPAPAIRTDKADLGYSLNRTCPAQRLALGKVRSGRVELTTSSDDVQLPRLVRLREYPRGGYRAPYLGSAATVRDASRGSREPPGAAMASISAPT